MNVLTWLVAGALVGAATSMLLPRRSWLLNVVIGAASAGLAGALLPPWLGTTTLDPADAELRNRLVAIGAALTAVALVNLLPPRRRRKVLRRVRKVPLAVGGAGRSGRPRVKRL